MIYDKGVFKEGFKDGIPIGLGYFAVSFSLGIAARNVGLTPFQAFLVSLTCNASAGEYAGFALIGASASYLEVAIMTFIANARYLLMSTALSQKMDSKLSLGHRALIGYDVTDELFAIQINRSGKLNPYYAYGAYSIALPCWAIGTMLGCIAGNIMPVRLVSAFSVALYGMFLAIIIPPSKKDKTIGILVVVSFLLSAISTYVSVFSKISSGIKTIALTVVISAVVSLIKPRGEEHE